MDTVCSSGIYETRLFHLAYLETLQRRRRTFRIGMGSTRTLNVLVETFGGNVETDIATVAVQAPYVLDFQLLGSAYLCSLNGFATIYWLY